MGEVPFDRELKVLRPNAMACATIVGCAMATYWLSIPFLTFALFFFAVQTARAKTFARLAPSRVRVDPRALWLGMRATPREEIRDARVVPTRGELYVRVSGRRRSHFVAVSGVGEGQALLHALGFAASQTTMRFTGRPPWMASRWKSAGLMLACIVVTLGFDVEAGQQVLARAGVGRSPESLWPAVLLFVTVLAMAGLVVLARRARVDVGVDGIYVAWLGTRRFVPSASIKRVGLVEKRNGSLAQIVLKDGTTVTLPLDAGENGAASMVARIREAIAVFGSSNVAGAAARLGRQGRDVRAWIDDLRAIGAGANVTLRVAPIPSEQLWHVLESPSAGSEPRAAAAVALAAVSDDDGCARLRAAAGTVADAKLRDALDAASRHDDDAIETALQAMT